MLFSDFTQNLPDQPRLRLAPTPSGFLHLGNALNFYLNWKAARSRPGGKILLRIDDLDSDRKRPEFVEDVFLTLDWLKIDWDEGPTGPDDFEKNWSQRHRIDLFEQILKDLRAKNLLFACGKSRRELADFGEKYPIPVDETGISALPLDSESVTWRVKTPPDLALSGFVARQRDGIPAYQVASLADDVHFKITHVVRGEDLQNSTEAQLFLAKKLGLSALLKIKFWYHPLILQENGEKLSKSAGANSLRSMRENGISSAQIIDKLEKMVSQF